MADELETLWERFSLTEKEEKLFDFGASNESEEGSRQRECIVGRVVTQKPINLKALSTAFNAMWKTTKGFKIQDGGDRRFVCEFACKKDKEKVLKERPWNFDKNLVILDDLKPHERPLDVLLSTCPFWIRVYDLPLNMRNSKALMALGDQIGEFMEVDGEDNNGIGRYVRIRVMMDVEKPLLRGVRVRNSVGRIVWAFFRYERLTCFCYWCGIIGHNHDDCGVKPEEVEVGNWPYVQSLRASPFRTKAIDKGFNSNTSSGTRSGGETGQFRRRLFEAGEKLVYPENSEEHSVNSTRRYEGGENGTSSPNIVYNSQPELSLRREQNGRNQEEEEMISATADCILETQIHRKERPVQVGEQLATKRANGQTVKDRQAKSKAKGTKQRVIRNPAVAIANQQQADGVKASLSNKRKLVQEDPWFPVPMHIDEGWGRKKGRMGEEDNSAFYTKARAGKQLRLEQ